MLLSDRRQKIMDLLCIQGSVTVDELSKALSVSEETVRRDLNAMEKEGLLNRVYGGAYLGNLVRQTLPNDMRMNTLCEEKGDIADICAGMIKNGDTIMLDASTTAYYVAKRITNYQNLTVITNSLDITYLLSDAAGVHVICCGGHLDKKSMSFMEMEALEELSRYYADTCFVSCTGISRDFGLSDSIEMQSRIRRIMIQHAQKKVCIADSTKLGKTTLCQIVPMRDMDAIVLDRRPPEEWIDKLRRDEVACYYPKSAD